MVNWYVLNTKPRKESQVESLLTQAGFTVYLPRYRQDSTIKPFFPGYLFLKFNYPKDYQKIVYTRGVNKIVGNGQIPVPVEPEVISCLKAREKNGLIELMKYGDNPQPGDEILVMEGPLKGLKGIFYRELSDRQRVMILLNYVSYQGSLLIKKNMIKKIKSSERKERSQAGKQARLRTSHN
ncbi:MAG TPA: transcription termination/antitermination NusG family protein [Candidatus Saccharicenans sp.]|jgi:transcription antitermination factor NusG|nr:transcription termination/antitermination NusG family protein [Candidatus Saccharicenans sp.]